MTGGFKILAWLLACATSVAPAIAQDRLVLIDASVVVRPSVGPNVFGTIALAAPDTRLSAKWHRVSAPAPGASVLELVEPVRGLSRQRQLLFVQSVVQRTIAYRPDQDLWGEPDYWATAAETLARGGGDCEDLAILKYQALLALGFSADQLVLSVGRDAGQGDHALLLVKMDAQWWVLDDNRPRPIQAEQRSGFEPMLSFSGSASQWLHGHAHGPQASLQPAARH